MFFGHGKRVIGKILIVEDEPLVAFENEHVLTHAGYEVVDTVNCCSHAELAIRSTKVDLVVTDIRLTGTRSGIDVAQMAHDRGMRSEEHTSELQSLMRISYDVFCLKKKNTNTRTKCINIEYINRP